MACIILQIPNNYLPILQKYGNASRSVIVRNRPRAVAKAACAALLSRDAGFAMQRLRRHGAQRVNVSPRAPLAKPPRRG